VVFDRVRLSSQATEVANAVRGAGEVGKLVQELQLERLQAVSAWVHSTSAADYDQAITEVNDHVTRLLGGAVDGLSSDVRVALGHIGDLNVVRAQATAANPDWLAITTEYATTIKGLIDALHLERNVDVNTAAGRQVVGLDAVLRADEQISASATLLVVVAAQPKNEGAFILYESSLAGVNVQFSRFTEFGTPEQVALYQQVQEEFGQQLGTLSYGEGVDPRPALANLSLFAIVPGLKDVISAGLKVENKIVTDVVDVTAKQKRTALYTAYGVGAAVLLVLILVGLLSAAVARAVVTPLTRLTGSADRVARVAQAELVRVADDEAEATSVIHLDPVDVRANDEIGDLARAFEEVQGTAVQLVERQAASRRNVAQMFGHIGRRTQNLVARQIALIDWLEREETDPARLQQLYRLDHVSSRLRRSAQSLVVLSGNDGANPHLNPLPLADLVRLALGEIEDYTRVDVEVPQDLVITPAAVSDLVLVLAELMENATAFSPPHTRVTVFGQSLPHGSARISVVDHGLGLNAERLAEENARLNRRERLDLTPTEVLGLFVVGRLARRHAMGVTLLSTPGGGLTATIQLPPELLVQPLLVAQPMAPQVLPPAPVPALPGRVVARASVLTAAPGPETGALTRAIESVRTGSAWNAFVPRQRGAETIEGQEVPLALPSVPAGPPAAEPVPVAANRASIPEAPPTWPPTPVVPSAPPVAPAPPMASPPGRPERPQPPAYSGSAPAPAYAAPTGNAAHPRPHPSVGRTRGRRATAAPPRPGPCPGRGARRQSVPHLQPERPSGRP